MRVSSRTIADCPNRTIPATVHYGSEVWGALVRDLLAEGRQATFRVRGVSMLPTLRDGDLVTLDHLGEQHAEVGEIVAFMCGPWLCLHRVLAVVYDGRSGRVTHYLTAGDGLLVSDGRQRAEAVIGKVVRVQSSRGAWSPNTLFRRAQSYARAYIGLHPRLRSHLRRAKRALRETGLVGGVNGRAGADL